MADFSICIPTFNRAPMLAQCLEYIAGFADADFEIVVGDNASTDNTAEVVASFVPRIKNLVYIRRSENIGFARNMDSVLRRATRKYIYILNDDDYVFEEALHMCERVMNANPNVAAMVGRYIGTRALDKDMRIDYSDAVATKIAQSAFSALLDNLSVCDGHPIIRREVFDRHCAYLDRTGTLIPLYFDLLAHGDLVVVDKAFFQHRTTGESLTARMAEAWFLDMANADLEVAISGCLEHLPPGALVNARQRLLQLLYFQGARMALNRKNYYILWLSLRRLAAVEGATQEFMVECEFRFAHDFLVSRIAGILSDSGLTQASYIASPEVDCVVRDLQQAAPGILLLQVEAGQEASTGGFCLCLNPPAPEAAAANTHYLALSQLIQQLRFTRHAATCFAANGRIVLGYSDPALLQGLQQFSQGFQVLCAPYSEL